MILRRRKRWQLFLFGVPSLKCWISNALSLKQVNENFPNTGSYCSPAVFRCGAIVADGPLTKFHAIIGNLLNSTIIRSGRVFLAIHVVGQNRAQVTWKILTAKVELKGDAKRCGKIRFCFSHFDCFINYIVRKFIKAIEKNRFMLSFGTYFVDDNWENNWFVKKTQLSCGSSRRYWHHSCTLQCMLLWWKSRWRSFRPWNIYSSRLRPVKSSYKCN